MKTREVEVQRPVTVAVHLCSGVEQGCRSEIYLDAQGVPADEPRWIWLEWTPVGGGPTSRELFCSWSCVAAWAAATPTVGSDGFPDPPLNRPGALYVNVEALPLAPLAPKGAQA